MCFLAPRSLQQERTEKEDRKQRHFSDDQIRQLERRFALQNYISASDRDEIVHSLGMSGAQVATCSGTEGRNIEETLKN